ncbi:hypothetical protein DEU56DRAFT_906373 [Suillus clintonianus]|uniref:uncharacterized protein n=1 Tax=Suillus clintonianus TaxID=1904413 RepID=UPI001B861ABB|nr:uncharacterized protein DEU56DRAFT_906373 [Suillus clintonianus]KAG2156202.1 hypothetical protein DEU56DRAFT_906373 [Suillus clintonianus]
MLSPFRAFSRQCPHLRACVPHVSRSFHTPLENDQSQLSNILQELSDPSKLAASNPSATWTQQGVRRRFDHKLFIRPHYFSHDHRFKGPPPFPKRSLIGPGTKQAKQQDIFYRLGVDPLQEASNDVLLSSFVTEMGKIKHRAETGLTTKSQRRLGKAIRRAKMMGIIPVLSSARLPWN